MIKTKAFTVVELLVVVSIIAILSAILYANFSQASAQSRDAKRQADLRTVQSAIELYKNRYGRYPAGCNGANVWSGQNGSAYACASGQAYIVGLAPEFIPVLPTDSRPNGTDSGYMYATNTEGSVYILKARKTVESEVVTYSHPFKSCDATSGTAGICDVLSSSYDTTKPSWCQASDPVFQTSYGVWGGFADEPYGWTGNARSQEMTERIVCRMD